MALWNLQISSEAKTSLHLLRRLSTLVTSTLLRIISTVFAQATIGTVDVTRQAGRLVHSRLGRHSHPLVPRHKHPIPTGPVEFAGNKFLNRVSNAWNVSSDITTTVIDTTNLRTVAKCKSEIERLVR